jgi:Ran GTPase-activating protein (RanGAP) involved in mRNA processing and transport
MYDENLKLFTPQEELSVSAMHSSYEPLHAMGFKKCQDAFPEAENLRQEAMYTGDEFNSLERYRKLFPASRYGASRTKKVFEDPTTFFRDLDPMVSIKMREEAKHKKPELTEEQKEAKVKKEGSYTGKSPMKRTASVFDMNPDYLNKLESKTHRLGNANKGETKVTRLKRAGTGLAGFGEHEDQTDPDLLAQPIVIQRNDLRREFDEKEMLESENGDFPSKTELFSQRVHTVREKIDVSMGMRDYLEACRQLDVAPNTYVLDNINRSHLDMQHAGLSGTGIRALSVPLSFNVFVKHLNLTDNKMGDAVGEELIKALSKSNSVTSLHLAGNNLAQKTGVALSEWLKGEGSQVQKLDLSRNRFNDSSVVPLGAALVVKGADGVRELLLNENNFGCVGASSLFKSFEGGRSSLKKLVLNTNPLDIAENLGELNRQAGKSFANMMTGLGNLLLQSNLVELDVSLCNLGDSFGSVVASLLGANQHSLRVLDASFNNITSVGAGKISKAISSNSFLQVLLLNGNFFGLETCLGILDSLGKNKSLIRLGLADSATDLTDGRDEGPSSTAESVEKSKHSMVTNLWVRNWGGVSEELIQAALAKMKQAEADKIQRDYELALAEAEAQQLLNPKKKVKKPKPPKPKKEKKPKKGAKPDTSAIPREFFLAAVEEAEERERALRVKEEERLKLEKEGAEGGAGGRRKSVSGGKGGQGGKKPTAAAAAAKKKDGVETVEAPPKEVATNPLSWQKKMGIVERQQTITEREECSKLFWGRVRKSLNARGVDCKVEGFAFDSLIG